MKLIFGACIFCVVLFIYLHVQFHLRTSSDLEMYEVDQPSKDKLKEICDIRQPVLFDFDSRILSDITNRTKLANSYYAFDINVRRSGESDGGVPLPLHAAVKLFDEDTNSTYYTERNNDFLTETSVKKQLQRHDQFVRPYMVSNCDYDILFGSKNAWTPLRYSVDYRNYFTLNSTGGSDIRIKLFPPMHKNTKYLHPEYDYYNFEFRSPINPWNPQPNYAGDFDKLKSLEFILPPGKTLFVPAYWWYSIQFMNPSACVTHLRYRTYMNNVAISPYIAMYLLQLQNVKHKEMPISLPQGQIGDTEKQAPQSDATLEPLEPSNEQIKVDNQSPSSSEPLEDYASTSMNFSSSF